LFSNTNEQFNSNIATQITTQKNPNFRNPNPQQKKKQRRRKRKGYEEEEEDKPEDLLH